MKKSSDDRSGELVLQVTCEWWNAAML